MRVLTEIVGGIVLLVIFFYGIRYFINQLPSKRETTDARETDDAGSDQPTKLH